MTMPLARREGLLIEDVADESVVYDVAAGRAHALSRVSGQVWRECDGEATAAGIAARLSIEAEVVDTALGQLLAAGLLAEADAGDSKGFSRRQLMKGVGVMGVAGVLLPAIQTVAVPTMAVAQTNTCCTNASLIGDTVGTRFTNNPIVNRVVGAGVELPGAGPVLGVDPITPRFNIDIAASTIRIDFVQQAQTYGGGHSFTFSSLQPRVPAGCPDNLVPEVVGVQVFTNKPNAPYVTATFTPTSVTVQIGPPGSQVDWLPGEFILLRLFYGCPTPPPPPIDPCCPPWNSQRLGEQMVYQGTGGISAPFTLKFTPTALQTQQLRAYVNYLSSFGTGINTISILFRLVPAGTGATCAPGQQILASATESWTATTGPNPPTPAAGLFPTGIMVVNTWYSIQTVISLNNGLTFFPASCANSSICVRIQFVAFKSEGSGAGDGRAVLQIASGGAIVERSLNA